ncbi:MAG: redoxin domain-containing protein [Aeromicrobium sp.]
MQTLKVAVVTAASALALVACGSSDSPTASASTSAPSSASSSSPDQASDDAAQASVPKQLKFTSTTTDGASFKGASLAGKPTVVWFWAPWCHICKGEAPGVRAAAESSDVEFLGVAALDSAGPMRGFVEQYGLDFTNLADTEAAVWARFGVTSQPSYAFITADGDVEVVPGSLSASELKGKIAELEKS